MDIDFEALRRHFLEEGEELLTRMEASILKLEQQADDGEALAELFRAVHTLKGDAAAVGCPAPAAFAHCVEDQLDSIRSGKARLTAELVSLLLESVDVLRGLLDSAQEGQEELAPAHRSLLEKMSTLVGMSPSGVGSAPPQAPTGITSKPAEATAPARRVTKHGETLRVGITKLDQLLTLVGEIAVAHGRLSQLLEDGSGDRHQVLEQNRKAEQLYLGLQDVVMKLRMVPVGPAFRQYARTIRDLARTHGKKARLVVEEGDVEVDNSVLQLLRDPLIHMIRNAVDHGIEAPEVRRELGKEITGQVTLRARYVAGRIVIVLEDDGAGLDRNRILAAARARGKVAEGETPADEDLLQMVFEPGFSTAREVSESSGRGVGMDVVRRNVEALRGSVDISSTQGQGTRVTIQLPLTLAIIDGLLVRIVDQDYVIPIDSVIESLDLPEEARTGDQGRGVVAVRARPLPYVRLREIFRINGAEPARECLIVVQMGDAEAGLVVDEVFGKGQTVIKPLARIFQGLEGISGSAILGDGEVAMILDVPALLRREIKRDRKVAGVVGH